MVAFWLPASGAPVPVLECPFGCVVLVVRCGQLCVCVQCILVCMSSMYILCFLLLMLVVCWYVDQQHSQRVCLQSTVRHARVGVLSRAKFSVLSLALRWLLMFHCRLKQSSFRCSSYAGAAVCLDPACDNWP